MENPSTRTDSQFAITNQHLAKISFGLTIDQVNEITLGLAHAEALVDVVRWFNDANETMRELETVRDKLMPLMHSGNALREPGELHADTLSTLLHRAVADIGAVRKLIESSARIKASRHESE